MPSVIWDRSAFSRNPVSGSIRFSVVSTPVGGAKRSMIACGLGEGPATHLTYQNNPDILDHAFLIDNDRWCVVERGLRRTAWAPFPDYDGAPQVGVFRIYMVGNRAYYTVGAAPRAAYDDGAWRVTLDPRRDGSRSHDADGFSNDITISNGSILARGDLVHEGYFFGSSSYKYLDIKFSRDEQDVYGEFGIGEVIGAESLGLLGYTATQRWPESAVAKVPVWRAFISSEVATSRVTAELPSWTARATDMSHGVVQATLPPFFSQAGGDDYPFASASNDVYARSPAWSTGGFAAKERWVALPGWRSRILGANLVRATVPATYARGGDVGNDVQAVVPSFASRNVVGSHMRLQPAHGAVILPFQMYVSMNGSSGDVVEDTPPLVFYLGGSISMYVEDTVEETNFPIAFGGSISCHRLVTLHTTPLVFGLGGSFEAVADASLPHTQLVFALGGYIGGAADQWGSLSEFDANNDVFSMSLDEKMVGRTTQYKGYAFNSCARVGSLHLGGNSDGLFVLSGDTDGGAPVKATFGFGQLDFGTPQVKTIAYCYMGTAAGGMRVNIKALLNGREASYTYPARAHGASMREVRFDFGRGLVSTYAQPTFYNTNGEYFEVDNVRFDTAVSARRI